MLGLLEVARRFLHGDDPGDLREAQDRLRSDVLPRAPRHVVCPEMYGAVRYTVRKGDTISTIARRFRVRQRQLREANNGRTFLRVGQHFNIVLSDTHRPAARKRSVTATKAKSRKSTNTRKSANMKVAYVPRQSGQSN